MKLALILLCISFALATSSVNQREEEKNPDNTISAMRSTSHGDSRRIKRKAASPGGGGGAVSICFINADGNEECICRLIQTNEKVPCDSKLERRKRDGGGGGAVSKCFINADGNEECICRLIETNEMVICDPKLFIYEDNYHKQ